MSGYIRYVYELLPEAARPSPTELTEEGARRLVDRIIKIRIQASRFRVRYNQFPKVKVTISNFKSKIFGDYTD